MSFNISKKELQELHDTIISSIQDKKGENIVSINVGALSGAVSEYYIICNANSNTQVDAIAHGVEKKVRELLKSKPWHVEGKDNSQWILLDYVSIMVPVFQTPFRDFYKLEELWADAPIKTYED